MLSGMKHAAQTGSAEQVMTVDLQLFVHGQGIHCQAWADKPQDEAGAPAAKQQGVNKRCH
jgi:hypothetical protein